MTPNYFSPFKSKRGSVLVIVLVFVVLLSFIVVAFMEEAVSQIKYFSLFHERDDLRIEAYSALETSLAVINEFREIEGALWGPEQGWSNPLAYSQIPFPEGIQANVQFSDESGKFPLNSLEYETWIALFQAQGFDLSVAETLTDSILDWIDDDDLKRLNGFDGEDYEFLDIGYKPANGPIKSWDEITLIPAFQENYFDEDGRPLGIFAQLKSALSLEHSGPVNINAMAPLVEATLVELGVIDPYSLESYKNGADGILGTEDDRLLRDAGTGIVTGENNNLVTTEISQLKVEVTVSRGDARFLLSALVQWSGANPSAGSANRPEPRETTASDEGNNDVNEDSAASRRQQARGGTQTQLRTAAQLGYPFKIIRLTENRKI